MMQCLIKHKNNIALQSIYCKIWYCLNIKVSSRKGGFEVQQCNMLHVLVFGNDANINLKDANIPVKG
jgi:hypothetical protein